MSFSRVSATRVNAAGARRITEQEASRAPTVNDDSTYDFEVGSIWKKYDTDNKLEKTYVCTDATDGAAVWAEIIILGASGIRRYIIEESLVFAGDAYKVLTAALPIGATPVEACINADTLVTATTAVKIGFGTAGDPDGYAKTAALTKNSKILTRAGALAGIPVVASTALRISAVDTSGAAAGTLDSGTVHVKLVYDMAGAYIADAA